MSNGRIKNAINLQVTFRASRMECFLHPTATFKIVKNMLSNGKTITPSSWANLLFRRYLKIKI